MTIDPHLSLPPSPWVVRWAAQIPVGGLVLDLACGSGRHARWLAAQGFNVLGVDRDLAGFDPVPPGVQLLETDLEQGVWPLEGRIFAGVVVTNYLHRPLFPHLLDAIAPGGVLVYETFAAGNEHYGRPARPEFLLQPGELLRVVEGRMTVIAYEDIYVDDPKPAMVQRLCAIRSAARSTTHVAQGLSRL